MTLIAPPAGLKHPLPERPSRGMPARGGRGRGGNNHFGGASAGGPSRGAADVRPNGRGRGGGRGGRGGGPQPQQPAAAAGARGNRGGGQRGRGGAAQRGPNGSAQRARGGANGRDRARGGRARGRPQQARRGGHSNGTNNQYQEYNPPRFYGAESLSFSQTLAHDSDAFVSKLDAVGVKSITFGADFEIRNEHLQAIIARPRLAKGLKVLSLGDSDTGAGAGLSDATVQALVALAPNLRVLSLQACTSLSGSTLMFALTHCPQLERLAITGNDKVRGRISTQSIKDLATNATFRALKELVLYDQTIRSSDAKALSAARTGLAVKIGETLGDGVAANWIAAATGGTDTSTYYGGRLVGAHVDSGLFGYDGFGLSDLEDCSLSGSDNSEEEFSDFSQIDILEDKFGYDAVVAMRRQGVDLDQLLEDLHEKDFGPSHPPAGWKPDWGSEDEEDDDYDLEEAIRRKEPELWARMEEWGLDIEDFDPDYFRYKGYRIRRDGW